MTSETDTDAKKHHLGVCPYGSGALSYNNYLKIKEIKELQICQSDPPHHDEHLFIIIHQAYELWFKLILHEVDETMKQLAAGNAPRATWFMRRVSTIFREVLVNQIHILETMMPVDFLGFRSKLNPASGFQSSQFREIEFAAGMKDPRLLQFFTHEPETLMLLQKRLEAPSLSDAFYQLLIDRGFDVAYQIEENQSEECEKAHAQRLKELRKIYQEPEKHYDLYELAETLVDLDENIALWRTHHVTVVERIIGFKRGTGGSEGVSYLRSTLTKRCFPDLWNVRTMIEL
ncbi:MAG: tryptophan 2,3-dioxygenase, partial [Candidatus Melainabacteria bacterium]|nr:tryptophan 2,3-dioxygenase [Candidatus Melainabacteria bacterium]